jgi:outer membrane protein, heavy metal efflux system
LETGEKYLSPLRLQMHLKIRWLLKGENMNHLIISYVILLLLTGLLQAKDNNEFNNQIRNLLVSHPEIQGYLSKFRSKKFDENHSDVYPDPKFGIAYRNYPYNKKLIRKDSNADTPSMTGMEYTVSQEIPFPGKLDLIRKNKKNEIQEIDTENSLKVSNFIENYLTLKIQYFLNQKRLNHYRSLKEILISLSKIKSASYIAGKSDLSSSNQYNIDAIVMDQKIKEAEYNISSIEASIEYYETTKELKDFLIKEYIIFLDLESKKFNKIQSDDYHPILKLAEIFQQKSLIEKKQANIEHFPDSEVFVSYLKRKNIQYVFDGGYIGDYSIMDTTEFRGDLFSFGITMKIPVWSNVKNHSLSKRSSENLKGSEFNYNRTKLWLYTERKKNLALYQGLKDRYKLLSEDHIKILDKSLSSLKANYQSGKGNFESLGKLKIEYYKTLLEQEDIAEKKYLVLINLCSLYSVFSDYYIEIVQGVENESN